MEDVKNMDITSKLIMRMACVIVIDSSQCSRVPTAFNPPKLRWYCEPTICRDKRHAVKSS
jgi:hypothetical protein